MYCLLLSITAICRTDCHQTRGYCEAPGECRCRLGWAGPICKECQVLPGCQHGTCSKPLECKCLPGYTGILCQSRKYKCSYKFWSLEIRPWFLTIGILAQTLTVSGLSVIELFSISAICAANCHQTRGYCRKPGECR